MRLTTIFVLAILLIQQGSATAVELSNVKLQTETSSSTANQLAAAETGANIQVDTMNSLVPASVAAPVYTYYASGLRESMTLSAPDASGLIYYHYIDENWKGRGYGRADRAQRAAALSGILSYTYSYFADTTGRMSVKRNYSDLAYTGLISTYTYYNTAAHTLATQTFTAPNASGYIFYRFLNENWAGTGRGRVVQQRRAVAVNGELGYSFTYFADTAGRISVKSAYSNAAFTTLIATYRYFNTTTHRLQAKETVQPNAQGNIATFYLDEDWNLTGKGRIDRTRRATPLLSELSHVYVYDGVTGALIRRKTYSDANWEILLPKTKEDFIEAGSTYFLLGSGVIDGASGYIYERPNNFYTQPTNIGFFVQYLSQVVTGDIVSPAFTKDGAVQLLQKIAASLLTDQALLGEKGLLPWFSFNGSDRIRDFGEYGQQVSFYDNANLSAALGSTIGALSAVTSDNRMAGLIDQFGTFLNNQQVGYEYLYDPDKGVFRGGFKFDANQTFLAYHIDRFGSEAAAGVLFVTLRYAFSDDPYTNLVTTMKEYVMQSGQRLNTVAPVDGGAFQMLWQILTMPELDSPALKQLFKNFVDIELDFAAWNNLPGFVSASFTSAGVYRGNQGIPAIAENAGGLYDKFASLYTLGAAFMVRPVEVTAFLKQIFVEHPDLVTKNGYWEGYDTNTGLIANEKVSANELTFILGIAGKGPVYMRKYLTDNGLYARFGALLAAAPPAAPAALMSSNFSQTADPWQSGSFDGSAFVFQNSWFYNQAVMFHEGDINMSGKKIRLRYISDSPGLTGLFYAMRPGDDYSSSPLSVSVDLSNTGGVEREIILQLPANASLSSVGDLAMLLSNNPISPGSSINLRITGLDLI